MNILGAKIIDIRTMTQKEMTEEGWLSPATVLVLDNGSVIYPSQDDEGNGSGTLFRRDEAGSSFYVLPLPKKIGDGR